MTFKLSKYTLRINSDLLKKFHCVARYNGHSSNYEIELLIRRYVKKFEDSYGKITLE